MNKKHRDDPLLEALKSDEFKGLISTESDVKNEEKFPHLNNSGFTRANGSRGQWFTMVQNTWNETKLPMNDSVRGYLVMMLERFTNQVDIFDTIVGFVDQINMTPVLNVRTDSLRHIADTSLLYVAHFPGRLADHNYPGSVNKSIEIGTGIFHELSNREQSKTWRKWYEQVAQHYSLAVIVLKEMGVITPFAQDELERIYGSSVTFPRDYEASQIKRKSRYFKQKHLLAKDRTKPFIQ